MRVALQRARQSNASARTIIVVVAVVGCLTSWPAAAQDSAVTFSRDIAPIVFSKCAVCHRPGAIGPFSLLSYQDARQHATQIAMLTRDRRMPPWKPVNEPDTFLDERRLSDAQIQTIQAWVAQGAPEGDPADLPPAPVWGTGWQLGEPDVVVRMTAPYDVAADGPDVFRTFVLPVPLTGPRYVSAIEFQPGNARVVHHANLGIDRTRASRRLDLQDPAPGYAGGMTSESAYPPGYMLGWTPGQQPRPSPEGAAWVLDSGSDVVVQLHMQPTGRLEQVQAAVGFYFTDAAPVRAPVGLRLGSQAIAIVAGDDGYVISDSYTVPVDADLLAVQPHAHNLARRMDAEAIRPDGTIQPLITIADWDFRWQDVYRFVRPVFLPGGTTVAMRFTYDNSAGNPRNPSRPPVPVYWGQNTTDEMGDLWLQLVPRSEADFGLLAADVERKRMADDLAGYLAVLERDPSDPAKHEVVAAYYLQEGRTSEAIQHLRESLRLQPDQPTALYSLGTALSLERRVDEAIASFEAALALSPAMADAHANLGAMLHLAGRLDEALPHYRLAIQLRPENADVHANLGRLLSSVGADREAVAEFRQAIVHRPDLVAALTGLAWTLATSADAGVRDPREAVADGEEAARLTGRADPSVLAALAAAYASAGNFVQATATAESGLAVANRMGNLALAAQIAQHLVLYRAGTAVVAQP